VVEDEQAIGLSRRRPLNLHQHLDHEAEAAAVLFR
jgi:hypothetical protein